MSSRSYVLNPHQKGPAFRQNAASDGFSVLGNGKPAPASPASPAGDTGQRDGHPPCPEPGETVHFFGTDGKQWEFRIRRPGEPEQNSPQARAAWLVYHAISARDMPISGVQKFRRDWKITKKLPDGVVASSSRMKGGKRGVIHEFSDKSRFRLLHVVKNCEVDFRSMLTLTYPAEFPMSGRTAKKHFKALCMALRRRFPSIRGIWFLEFQMRGAPHFHVMLDFDLASFGELEQRHRKQRNGRVRSFWTVPALQEWVSEAWFRVVASGDRKHLRAGSSWEVIEHAEGALRYAAAHAAKPHQKKVPAGFADVGRFWGIVGDVQLPSPEFEPITAEELVHLLGHEVVLSSKNCVRKYLWDATTKTNL